MSVTLAVDDAKFVKSPYTWVTSGSTSTKTNCVGAYVKVKFTASATIAVAVDVAALVGQPSAEYPVIKYVIDSASATYYQLTSSDTTLTLASGLSLASHTLELNFSGAQYTGDRWNALVEALKITSFSIDDGGSFLAPTVKPKSIFVLGDSNTEGHEARSLGTGPTPLNQDGAVTYARLLARDTLNCEIGQVGYAGQGLVNSGTGGVPTGPDAWDFYWNAQSRLTGGLLVPGPDFILCNYGINDSGGDQRTAMAALIPDLRAAAPNARILVVVPWTGVHATDLTNAVSDAGDANTVLINTGVTSYGTSGTHLSAAGHQDYADDIAAFFPAPGFAGVRVLRQV